MSEEVLKQALGEPVTLPEHETEAMHDAVMAVLYQGGATRGNTDRLWQAYRSAILAAVPTAQQTLTTCNCRWDGETQVQRCTLHEAHVDAIHEWAERAKTAEKALAQEGEQPEFSCGVDVADNIVSVTILRRRPDDVAEFIHSEQIELATPAAQPVSALSIAGIGLKHFGNPIPKAWYSAAKELLEVTK